MAQQAPRRRPAAPVSTPGAVDPEHLADDGVQVFMDTRDGSAVFMPARLASATPAQRSAMKALQGVTLRRYELEEELAGHVAGARRLGLSWASIGWAIGITGDAVRKAYSD
jgi:hypothetical protein